MDLDLDFDLDLDLDFDLELELDSELEEESGFAAALTVVVVLGLAVVVVVVVAGGGGAGRSIRHHTQERESIRKECILTVSRTAALVHDVKVLVRSEAWITEELVVCRDVTRVLVLTSFQHFAARFVVDAVHVVLVLSFKINVTSLMIGECVMTSRVTMRDYDTHFPYLQIFLAVFVRP